MPLEPLVIPNRTSCSNLSNYETDVTGNDPYFSLKELCEGFLQQETKNFLIIGCSGLRNLQLIKDILDAHDEEKTTLSLSIDLVIIDNSEKVNNFWKLFIQHVGESDSVNALLNKIDVLNESGRPYLSLCNPSQQRRMASYVRDMLDNHFAEFKKTLTQRTSIRLNSWTETPLFEQEARKLKQKIGKTFTIVYASNILEYLDFREQPIMLSNIALLSASEGETEHYVCTVHTRTSLQSRMSAIANIPKAHRHNTNPNTIFLPDVVICVPDWERECIKELDAANLIVRIISPTPESSEPSVLNQTNFYRTTLETIKSDDIESESHQQTSVNNNN